MANKNILLKKTKEFFSLVLDLVKLEINLFIQEIWEQTVPIFPLILGLIASLLIFFIAVIFLGFTITAVFYLITNSYWLSFMISALILFVVSLGTMILLYFKLKNYHFNLEKTLKQFENKDEIF